MIKYIGVLYDDENPESYGGIRTTINGLDFIINTGRPTVDYWAIIILLNNHYSRTDLRFNLFYRSSIDHFIMDGGDLRDTYDEGYSKDSVVLSEKLEEEFARFVEQCENT